MGGGRRRRLGGWATRPSNAALEFSGYQVEHSWGTGTHNGRARGGHLSRCHALPLEGLGRSRSKRGKRRIRFSKRSSCPTKAGKTCPGSTARRNFWPRTGTARFQFLDYDRAPRIHKFTEQPAPTRARRHRARHALRFRADAKCSSATAPWHQPAEQAFVEHCPVNQLLSPTPA